MGVSVLIELNNGYKNIVDIHLIQTCYINVELTIYQQFIVNKLFLNINTIDKYILFNVKYQSMIADKRLLIKQKIIINV